MRKHWILYASVAAGLVFGGAHAFQWTPFEFPEGDQGYTLEIYQGADPDRPSTIMDIDVVDSGEGFDVTTNMTFEQRGVQPGNLQDAIFSGGFTSMFAMGPMMMFGPASMMLPMVLGDEDIRVRAEPIRIMGFGRMHMEREIEMAGHTCVVVRVEPDQEGAQSFEFAVADDVPFPCYSSFGEGEDAVEIRLVRVE